MSGWISVSERLPKYSYDVLVADANWQSVAYIIDGEWKAANVDCGANFRVYLDFTPTHWQPLPEPPCT